MTAEVLTYEVAHAAANSNITVNKPFGTASGDLLISHCRVNHGSASWSTPAGWTRLDDTSLGFSGIFYKIAGSSEPANYTFTQNQALNDPSVMLYRVVGHNATTPIAAYAVLESLSGTTQDSPSVTATSVDSLLVSVAGVTGVSSASTTLTHPTGMTLEISETANRDAAVATLRVNAGATGTKTWTQSPAADSNNPTVVESLVINPGPAAPPVKMESVSTKNETLATSTVIDRPLGTALNDLLVAVLYNDAGGSQAITAPSGWTPIGSPTATGRVWAFWKKATASEETTYTFTGSGGSSTWVSSITRLSGVDTDVQIAASALGTTNGVTGTTVTLPSVTATTPDTGLIQLVISPAGGTFTAPATAAKRYDQNTPTGGHRVAGGTEKVQSGASGTRAWVSSNSSDLPVGAILAVNPAPAAAVEIHEHGSGQNNTTGTVTVTKPANTIQNNLLIAEVRTNGAATWTTPSGWTLISSSTNSAIYWKIAGASEPADYSFTNNQVALNPTGLIYRVVGHNTTSPIITGTSQHNATATTSHDSPSVSATVAGQTLVCFHGAYGATTPPSTAPSSMVLEVSDSSQSRGHALASQLLAAAGATGTRTWTQPSSAAATTSSIIINPATGTAPPAPSNINRSSTLFLRNSTTVDTGAGIDVRWLASANTGSNDVTQSVRFAHTNDNVERTFDPATALDTTVASADTLQRKGWALRLAEDMTPGDDTNCNAVLTAGTLTVPLDVNLNMNGGTGNVGVNPTNITLRASLWRYNPSTDAGTVIATGSQLQAWNTTSLGDNNTYKTVTVSVNVASTVEFAQGEILLLQVGVLSGTLPNAVTGTTNFDITLRIDNAVSRIAFAAGQGIKQVCTLARSLVGEGLAPLAAIALAWTRSALGEGLVSSSRAVVANKSFTVPGEGLVTHQKALTQSRNVVGDGLTSMTRAVVAAKTLNVIGEGLVSRGALILTNQFNIVGEGLVSSTKATVVAKTINVVGEGLATESRQVLAVRSFTVAGEGLVSRNALNITQTRNVVGEGLTTMTRSVVASKVTNVVGEGQVTRGALILTFQRNLVGEGLVTETHPVQAYRVFDLTGEGLVVMNGPGASTVTIPIDEIPEVGGGTTTVINPIFVFDD